METQCIQEQLAFQQLGGREVIGRFDGGAISWDAGGVLRREVEKGCEILKRVAGCFRDYRDLERTVKNLRQAWPEVRIIVRGDSGFCRDEIMSWCEQNEKLDYVLGLAKNERLRQEIEGEMARAQAMYRSRGAAARVFKDFGYRTHKSWSRARRVVGKAEYLAKEPTRGLW